MARLAIRATGDKSRRENVTTGHDVVRIACTCENDITHMVEYRYQSGTPSIKVYRLSQRELAARQVYSETQSA